MTTINDYDWDRLAGLYSQDFIEKMKGLDGKACWEGYKLAGTKKKGGKTVDNCVPLDSKHKEGDVSTAEMTPNFLPKKDIPGGGDLKNPRMAEAAQRMPRDTVLKKLNDRDGLAMEAAPNASFVDDKFRERPGARRMRERQEHNRKHGTNYSEDDHDPLDSDEPNGNMIVTQLRVIREKTDILLGMLDGSENLEPWVATKVANAGVAIASVADYLRFGGET
jgi:hypothetical protein